MEFDNAFKTIPHASDSLSERFPYKFCITSINFPIVGGNPDVSEIIYDRTAASA